MDFDQRVQAEISILRRYAYRLTRDPAAIEDLVQESLIRGLSNQHLGARAVTYLPGWAQSCTTFMSASCGALCEREA